MLVIGVLTGSCHDNETSFFIEHAKSQPEPPDCVVGESDPKTGGAQLDLTLGYNIGTSFLVRNQLVAREDYDNLKAESNGIFIDAADVSLRSGNNQSLGSTRIAADDYVDPESTLLAGSILITGTQGFELAQRYSCLPLNSQNYPLGSHRDVNGNPVPRWLGSVQAVVRFLGHTNGDVEVETPPFIFHVELCCGCNVNWMRCVTSCDAQCTEPDEEHGMCNLGVSTGDSEYDCRLIYYNPAATWEPARHERDICVDDFGLSRPCTCADCSG